MTLQDLFDELTINSDFGGQLSVENANYQLIVEADRGPQAVTSIRWEHAAEVVVIELDPDL